MSFNTTPTLIDDVKHDMRTDEGREISDRRAEADAAEEGEAGQHEDCRKQVRAPTPCEVHGRHKCIGALLVRCLEQVGRVRCLVGRVAGGSGGAGAPGTARTEHGREEAIDDVAVGGGHLAVCTATKCVAGGPLRETCVRAFPRMSQAASSYACAACWTMPWRGLTRT